MSQSKTTYGAELPKGTARSRREQHPKKASDSCRKTIEPDCRTREIGRGIDRRKWRDMPYNSRTRAFYEPCGWCFPDGEPSDSEVKKVVRSCREPTAYHRLRENDESACEHETATKPTRLLREAIGTITDLRAGERVIWKGRERPLRVTEATGKPDGTVSLSGPDGGECHIEGRPNYRQPYYIFGDGYRSVIERVQHENRAEKV